MATRSVLAGGLRLAKPITSTPLLTSSFSTATSLRIAAQQRIYPWRKYAEVKEAKPRATRFKYLRVPCTVPGKARMRRPTELIHSHFRPRTLETIDQVRVPTIMQSEVPSIERHHAAQYPDPHKLLQPLAPLAPRMKEALALLATAPANRLFAKITVKGHDFTVTQGDILTTTSINGIALGDVLRMNQIRELGSPKYTLRGAPYVDERLALVRAVVVEHGRARQVKAKAGKQRKGRRKLVTFKHSFTRLRITQVDVNRDVL